MSAPLRRLDRNESKQEKGIHWAIVAGGSGQVGHMFASMLASSGIEVTSVDTNLPVADREIEGVRYGRGDITQPSDQLAQELARADLVLLAVPEHVALAAVAPLAQIMRQGALLADTLSVKSRIANRIFKQAAGLEAISLNPMFAPSLGMFGRPIAVIDLVDGPRSQALKELLRHWGARVVLVEAAEHDHLTAAMQVATHSAILAFGTALRALGADISELRALAPPPHLTLLAMLARISSGVPDVYWDIQAANPEAPSAREALWHGMERLQSMVDSGDESGFAALFGEMQTLLGVNRAPLAEICERLFAELPLEPRKTDE
jgi:prephenate dehydrogenase